MRRIRESRLVRYVVLPISLVAVLSGCYKWVPYESPLQAREALLGKPGSEARLVTADSTVTLHNVSFADGNFVGYGEADRLRQPQVAIPFEDVTAISTRKASGKTWQYWAGLTSAVGLVVFVAVMAESLSQLECPFGCPE